MFPKSSVNKAQEYSEFGEVLTASPAKVGIRSVGQAQPSQWRFDQPGPRAQPRKALAKLFMCSLAFCAVSSCGSHVALWWRQLLIPSRPGPAGEAPISLTQAGIKQLLKMYTSQYLREFFDLLLVYFFKCKTKSIVLKQNWTVQQVPKWRFKIQNKFWWIQFVFT